MLNCLGIRALPNLHKSFFKRGHFRTQSFSLTTGWAAALIGGLWKWEGCVPARP